jgi:TolB protein
LAAYPGLNSGGDVSADGRRVVLTLSKDGNPELYVLHVDENRLVRLTQTPKVTEASPSWSPDGREIVFVANRAGPPQLYIMNLDGGEPRQITYRGSENVAPDWGPNGRIAFTSRRDGRYVVCVFDPAENTNEPVVTDGADYEDPSWAPDGRHIVCARTERYQTSLYVVDTQGDAPRKLTTPKGDWYSPACSAQ